MTNLPSKVSIIVPVYNVENYLAKCLDSLVNQSLQDIEILVIDDGSKDKSGDIIEQYAGKYPEKIKAFTKENGGLSDARNYGIDRATGEYIGFVDSDDYVAETMFEEMFLLAEKYHTKMVISNIQKVDEHGNITQKLTQIPNMPELIDLNEHFSVFSDLSYFACNKLFKKEIFDHKRFKKGVHFEDIQLIPQLLLKCDQIAQTQNFHYQYLERSDSITKTHTEKGLDILKAVADVEQVFYTSDYAHKKKELKNFQIFEGVYSFLAYLAFVKNEETFFKMSGQLDIFMQDRQIKIQDILTYSRFGKNYLLYLPLKKKIFYLLFFAGQQKLIRKLM
ncbi:glycosyltransferase family 2 protein [Chryseobacterium indologenes]|uniref:glycosyltransferase family 2 protein n=1 Tax=Chryseobacterium TaxID=59732 RepID=UPI0003E07F5F|nr:MULTISPECIES: glycosyltransferase family 2 protein [Chryseobacterium]ASE62973.1 glycosyltransferase family 2 protein [Chryseobacterium indologenes]AYZ34125.1 glycosyltransferase family 2 protein [Chryseobacterium indologenes]MBF6642639.1 glycosyltransferase family 2 protein [Chryseobacterium indologenes]MEB4761126.1 glycosyltransferase family 2 protein [Chryseobacterium indologenes]QPQ52901.1 glycosyltransferase family 2 protein [Chryseobacterium indologenes]